MDYKKIFKRETKTIVYVVVCLTLVVVAASYAMFLQVDNNTDNQVIETGSLVITYTNKNGQTISESDVVTNNACLEPMTDDESEGMTDCSYYLNIFNRGSLPASYRLVVYNNVNELPDGGRFVNHDAIKVHIKKGSKVDGNDSIQYVPVANSPALLSSLPHSSDTQFKTAQNEVKYVLDSGTLEAAGNISYNVQAFIHEDLTQGSLTGQYVYLKLEVTGIVDGEAPITNDNNSGNVIS